MDCGKNDEGHMVTCGLDVLLDDVSRYTNRTAAILCNQTSLTRTFLYGWDALRKAGIRLVRIFSPEHGLFAVEQDQKQVQELLVDGIEIVSLYGDSENSLVPDAALLADIDIVFMDIQDIGARYYTYLNTMAYFLRAVNGTDIECVVLDRPNPIGGWQIEGPGLLPDFASFVGVFDVPVRHGLTGGELLLRYHKTHNLDCGLTIVPLRGWQRKMYLDDTSLQWVPPSPNMPTLETAIVYPGTCLLEGTNLSEGRGTTTPFQIVGAPFIGKNAFANKLNEMRIPGVYFRPVAFRPTFHKYAHEICEGVFMHVLDRKAFQPFFTGVALLHAALKLYGDAVEFVHGVYEFNDTHPAFDLLCGTDIIREKLLTKGRLADIRALWRQNEEEWDRARKDWWLYHCDAD
jgi:uncharacterized protein YbbC (DUF1343 family)